jgi:hypothetical protein
MFATLSSQLRAPDRILLPVKPKLSTAAERDNANLMSMITPDIALGHMLAQKGRKKVFPCHIGNF